MGTLLSDLGLVATEVLEYAVTVANSIAGNSLLLLTVGVLFLGSACGILGRLLSRS